jgi:hypothetical protein
MNKILALLSISIATTGAFSVFKGTILADQAVTMMTSSTMEGRALAFSAGVTYNGEGNSLPSRPETPRFTNISRTGASSVTVVITTTPNFLLKLETRPNLAGSTWTTITTDTPTTSPWTYTGSAVDCSYVHPDRDAVFCSGFSRGVWSNNSTEPKTSAKHGFS